METKPKIVKFDLIDNQVLAQELEQVKKQAEEVIALGKQQEQSLETQVDFLREQRRAVEKATYEKVDELFHKNPQVMEFREQVSLKANFDKRVPEITEAWGKLNLQMTEEGNIIVVINDDIILNFSRYAEILHVEYQGQDFLSVYSKKTDPGRLAKLLELFQNFEVKLAEAKQVEIKDRDVVVLAEKRKGKQITFLKEWTYSKGESDEYKEWEVVETQINITSEGEGWSQQPSKAYKISFRTHRDDFSKFYKTEKKATSKFVELTAEAN
jgi:hypothetical protein